MVRQRYAPNRQLHITQMSSCILSARKNCYDSVVRSRNPEKADPRPRRKVGRVRCRMSPASARILLLKPHLFLLLLLRIFFIAFTMHAVADTLLHSDSDTIQCPKESNPLLV